MMAPVNRRTRECLNKDQRPLDLGESYRHAGRLSYPRGALLVRISSPLLPLPGLDFLISVCRRRALRVELRPPQAEALLPGDMLLGQPFDPLLQAILSRFNGGFLHDWFVLPIADTSGGIGPFNKGRREIELDPWQNLLMFAGFDGLAYYLATVPSLADDKGVQPVIYLNLHEGVEILPIASSVDKAFDLYAGYLEALAARHGSIQAAEEFAEEEGLDFHFPEDVPHLVARDERILKMLKRKQFDFLTAWDKRSTDWIARVQREALRLA